MSEQDENKQMNQDPGYHAAPVKPCRQPAVKSPVPGMLPPFKVLLHNDDINEVPKVVQVIRQLTRLTKCEAEACTREADQTGISLLLVTHQERAELYVEQFRSCGLVVTAEPA